MIEQHPGNPDQVLGVETPVFARKDKSMRTRQLWFPILLAWLFGLAAGPTPAQQPKGDPNDQTAIAKKAEAFVEAFHKGDAKAVAAFWVVDGDYTDQAGRHLKGRD